MTTKPDEAVYSDPPGMPDDESMTDAELRTVREALGFTGDWLAARLGVEARSYRRWESGDRRVPDDMRRKVQALEALTGRAVGEVVDAVMDAPDPTVIVYRTDADYHAAHPEMSDWPASWHRAVVYRASLKAPALAIAYAPEPS